jgi:hypothetical protein
MKLLLRAAGFVVGAAAIAGGQLWLEHAEFPRQAAAVSVESVNGSNETARRARLLGPLQSAADDAAIVMIVALAAACFAKPVMEQITSTWGSRLKGDSRA